ncbi:methyltransferase domain-containing protein [Brucepastera parasyntrophica]|uniref:class I SAM-dependent methyltransferase n=1 Tax=Brucepastera parasyntrophica TaxID=2880008 RepID=UPI00210C1A9C|nr:class I SAM-dependent methyltransferase [Brucepastera parasyntrophica]ULQ58812.1 methyltransferase domain-containing protein [Brucepastera parasyntrophica]
MYAKNLSLFQRSADTIWTDPYISKNLLESHLDDTSDGASRNSETRKKTIEWINSRIAPGSTILDLGCGPGLYANDLAGLGHHVTGIDVNRESIQYAQKHQGPESLTEYRYGNYLEETIAGTYAAVIMIYCDFGALIPQEQKTVLRKIRDVLTDGGVFIFDVFGKGLRDIKKETESWEISDGGDFWSASPHFIMEEVRFFDEANAIGTRYFIANQESGKVKEYILWDQYYEESDITAFMKENGFSVKTVEKDLITSSNFTSEDVMFIIAEKSS